MTLGVTLEELLAAKASGSRLLQDLERIKEKAEPLLAQIPKTFPEYTEHGASHSKRIIGNLNCIFSDAVKQSFNEYEIYFLLASAYLHDLGMIDFPNFALEQNSKGI